MAGLILIVILFLWILFCRWLSRRIIRRYPDKFKKPLVKTGLFALLISLILIDEIIAAPQYAYLCFKNAHLVLDDNRPHGKIVWFDRLEKKETLAWPLPIEVRTRRFVEVNSSKPVYHYRTVNVRKGGFLIRGLHISETGAPLLFEKSCAPKEFRKFHVWRAQHGITEIPRPI